MSTAEAYEMAEMYGGSSATRTSSIFAGAAILIIVLLIVCIAAYIINAIGIYKFLKMTEYNKPWMAWIPVAQVFAWIDTWDDESGYYTFNGMRIPSGICKWAPILVFVIGIIPLLSALSGIIGLVVRLVIYMPVMGSIFAELDNKDEHDVLLKAIVCAIIPIVFSCLMFKYSREFDAE